MKAYYQTILFLITILLLSGGGCASITKIIKEDIMGEAGSDEVAPDSIDPVAEVAMRYRRPAFDSSSYESDSMDSRAWKSRYSAPVAETIGYGMDMGEVSSIWGEPGSVESAGDPREGNQRWTYYSGLSSRNGLGSKRIVYFEGGHVAGWKAHQ
jgi:hypothetical protein